MVAAASFPFVQFEFGFLLGPADGRYLIRAAPGEDARVVVVLKTLGAPQRRLLRGRRPRSLEREAAEPVPTARATLVRAVPFESEDDATRWLDGIRRDPERASREVTEAATALNAVLRAHRAVAADPYARDVHPGGALAVRVGHGGGEQVAEGRFEAAYALPRRERRTKRVERLSPQEHLAAVLGGREAVLVAEELVLRARADIEAHRPREAALQARIALECLLAELDPDGDRRAFAELESDRRLVSQAGNAALRGDPPPALRQGLDEAVGHMEAALRRRRLRAPD